jgi:hypothetical protein
MFQAKARNFVCVCGGGGGEEANYLGTWHDYVVHNINF